MLHTSVFESPWFMESITSFLCTAELVPATASAHVLHDAIHEWAAREEEVLAAVAAADAAAASAVPVPNAADAAAECSGKTISSLQADSGWGPGGQSVEDENEMQATEGRGRRRRRRASRCRPSSPSRAPGSVR